MAVMNDKAMSMLGLAAKAGKVASGEYASERAVKSGNAYLVIVAEDASENTKKKYRDMTGYYGVPFMLYGTKERLGRSIGKDFRASLAVTDEKLARAVEGKIES